MTNKIVDSTKKSSDTKKFDGIFNGRIRFIVLILSTLCLTLGMCNAMALHFTVICMTVPQSFSDNITRIHLQQKEHFLNQTKPHNYESVVPYFTFSQQGWLFSGLAMGTLLGSLLLNAISNHMDFRHVFSLYGLLGGLATILVPAATKFLIPPINFATMMCIRILEGLILAISYVAMEKISTNWSPLGEATLFMGVISSHFQFGRCITMLLSGVLCDVPYLGWTSIYYMLGSMTISLFSAFYCFYKNTPNEHKSVNERELKRIQDKRNLTENKREKTDRKVIFQMLINPHAWAVFISGMGITLGQQLFTQYGPTFFKIAHNVSTNGTGILTGLPYLCSAIAAPIMGWLCDRIIILRKNPKLTITMLATGSEVAIAFCYLFLSLMPTNSQIWLIQLCFILAVVFNGFWVIGIVKFVKMVSHPHTQALNSLNTFVLYSIAMLVPYFVNIFISKETTNLDKWSTMFLLTAIIQLVCAAISQISISKFKVKVDG